MDFLNEFPTLDILLNENEYKKITVVLLNAQNINNLNLIYINKNGELKAKEINYSHELKQYEYIEDFLIYDGHYLYVLNDNYLKSIDKNDTIIPLSKETTNKIMHLALNLFNAINNQNKQSR